jgi:hypothetical protein
MVDNNPIALKIDVDTHDGMRDGVPALLDILKKHQVKATFCLSFGPDYSGRAIFRVFRDPAFLKKMLSTGAPSLYGWRTILSGTLLPPRPIATAFPELVRDIVNEGHEAVVHAWNHRFWQDHLHEISKERIMEEFSRSFKAFKEILGTSPRAVAAPGWQATPDSLEVEEGLHLDWASDFREGPPCFLKVRNNTLSLLQIPTTGPCIEELLTEGIREKEEISRHLLSSQAERRYPVLAVHAEVEGGPFSHFFHQFIPSLLSSHGRIITMGEMAGAILSHRDEIPVRNFTRITLPGRAGTVASSV